MDKDEFDAGVRLIKIRQTKYDKLEELRKKKYDKETYTIAEVPSWIKYREDFGAFV